MIDDTTRLPGLDGLAVAGVDDGDDGPVVRLVTADEQARRCPECGTRVRRSKGGRTTRPRDLPVGGRRPAPVWRKRRWRCDEPDCPRRSFTEAVASVPARKRLTTRLRAAVADKGDGRAVRSRSRRVVAGGRRGVHRACAGGAAGQPQPVAVLGIDEIRRGRPKWEFDEVTGARTTVVDRWHVGSCDLSGGQGLLGQVEGRAQTVIDWLGARPCEWGQRVGFVAIDMCTVFKSAIRQALPHARLVVDHFHLAQLADATVTEVRRRITIRVRGRRLGGYQPVW